MNWLYEYYIVYLRGSDNFTFVKCFLVLRMSLDSSTLYLHAR